MTTASFVTTDERREGQVRFQICVLRITSIALQRSFLAFSLN